MWRPNQAHFCTKSPPVCFYQLLVPSTVCWLSRGPHPAPRVVFTIRKAVLTSVTGSFVRSCNTFRDLNIHFSRGGQANEGSRRRCLVPAGGAWAAAAPAAQPAGRQAVPVALPANTASRPASSGQRLLEACKVRVGSAGCATEAWPAATAGWQCGGKPALGALPGCPAPTLQLLMPALHHRCDF